MRGRIERAIADRASSQRGLVTRTQLLAMGLTPAAIDTRVRSARLHPLYRGVYLVAHPEPTDGARELGAVLACAPRAVLSHRSAAVRWRLHPTAPSEVEVTVVGRNPGHKPGIRIHRVRILDRRDFRTLGEFPVQPPPERSWIWQLWSPYVPWSKPSPKPKPEAWCAAAI